MSNSAHSTFFDWIFGRKQEHQDSGWQRESPQDTGGYRLPDLLTGIAGGRPWTGPTGTWSDVYRGETPHRRRGQETGGMRQLPAGLDRLDWADIDTVKQLPMSDLLNIRLPNNALPARRPVTDRPIAGQIPANSRTNPRDELNFADLPTWLAPSTIEARISAALPPLPADDAAWLNSEPLRLTPLPDDAIAATDRTAGNIAFVECWAEPEHPELGVTAADMQPDLCVLEPTELSKKVREQRALDELLQATKGSEG